MIRYLRMSRLAHALLFLGVVFFASPAHAQFADIDTTHPNYHAIIALQQQGVVQGFDVHGQAFFRPRYQLNRAEALKMLLEAKGLPGRFAGTSAFPDVSADAWFAPYVRQAGSMEIVRGFPDGTFRPGARVQASEFWKMLALTFDIPVKEADPDEFWYRPYLAAMYQWRLTDAEGPDPAEYVNRAQAAEMIYRASVVMEGDFESPYVYAGRGWASYYAASFDGRSTASGEIFDSNLMTAAHRTLPFGTRLLVSTDDGASVVVKVNDRGPYHEDRVLDLSRKAFEALAPVSSGVVRVNYEVYTTPTDTTQAVPEYVRPKLLSEAKNTPIPEVISQTITAKKQPQKTLPNEAPKSVFGEKITSVPTDFYENATLRRTIPRVIPTGTVLMVSGRGEARRGGTATVFLQPEDKNQKQIHFSAEVSGQNFQIPVHFFTPGKYMMGLVFDGQTLSRVTPVEVRDLTKEPILEDATVSLWSELSAQVVPEDKEAIFSFESAPNRITKLIFKQGAKKKNLFVEDGISDLTLPYSFFEDFRKGQPLLLTLAQAPSADGTLAGQTQAFQDLAFRNYRLLEGFPDTQEDTITVHDFPRYRKNLQNFTIAGRINDSAFALADHAYLILPTGHVRDLSIRKNGDEFAIDVWPDTYGTHIFEIVSNRGEILFNRGMYIYEDYVLPVYPRSNLTAPRASKDSIISWVNELRRRHNRDTVVGSAELHSLAQEYATRMATEGFISHTDPQGHTLEDRIKDKGYTGEYGENLSYGSTLDLAMGGLENSASHRKNILLDKWGRVGIGIAQNNEGEYYIVQVFGK